MSTITATPEQVTDAARVFAAEPAVRAVAFWSSADGSTALWPQATVDNRRSRVLARISNLLGEQPADLVIVRR